MARGGFDQFKDQLSMQRRHSATPQRGYGLWHNWGIGELGRSPIAYDH